ncbi:MAG: class II fructose-bisphosphate aldolase [Lachnospiraceae bacterium]
MPLVTTTEMFKKAYNGGYAIGAFNVNNMEIVQGITEAAGELKSPVILQVSKGASCLCKPYIPCKISRSSSY